MTWVCKIYIFVLLIYTLTGCKENSPASAEQMNEDQIILNNKINEVLIRDGIPSIAACIVNDGVIVWQNTYGFADSSTHSKPTEETIYLLASISKLFTATAVMLLHEKGNIDIDTDINNYLPFELRNPNFPEVAITTRMLLTHRSSLANPGGEDSNFYESFPADAAPPLFPWIKNYLVPGGSEYAAGIWTNSLPGQNIGSSNAGVALLGYLVEAVSGKDFADFCKENIFQPLDMNNTGFRLSDVDGAKLAELYSSTTGLIEPFSVKYYPSGLLRSSIEDLSHFIITFMNGGVYKGNRLLQETTVDEMLTIKFPDANLAFGSGLGLMWRGYGNNEWVGHTGGGGGVSTSMDFVRTHKVGIIILSNKSGRLAVYPGGEIYNLLHQYAETYF